jgi:tRNA/rRNA methyltransferase
MRLRVQPQSIKRSVRKKARCRRIASVSSLLEPGNLRVVLVNTRNPLNIGAAARAMSNFGFLRLRVVNPFDEAWREARSAVGASPLLTSAEEFTSISDAVADCAVVVGATAARDRELNHPLHALHKAAPLIHLSMAAAPVALLFGSEKRGLSNEDLSHCHFLLRIPTRAEHGSMNLGQAVAICLYELVRDAEGERRESGAVPNVTPRATQEELQRITTVLLDALAQSGYSDPRTAAATEEKVRRLVRRLDLSAEDAIVWLGMLRQIVWKLGNSGAPRR